MAAKVTIQDIADALGISRNTVSKAMNNAPGLAEATRERILQKATEMGYKQFSYVQSLRLAAENAQKAADALAQEAEQPPQFREVALLTSFHLTGSHFASLMLDRLQQELHQMGFQLNTYHVSREELRNGTLPSGFRPDQVSAVVCIEMFDWDYDRMLCDLGLPILFVDGPACPDGRSLPADLLLMDNTTGLTQLLRELLAKGVRRIGFLGDYLHCQSFYERYLAYRTALLLAGVPAEERFLLRTDSPRDVYDKLAALEELPELFICANDFVAYDALQALRKLGKAVPEDVMLCGFDDAPESRMVVPALTTVHIHTQIMAFSAAQLLITRIREPSLDYCRVYTQTDLIRWESTGAVQAN
ncbi:MAG: LacI family DNA-binding transcriptional regulator [Oscillospiraceae bacterium]|nr:LacI family DNA-binding transcriptional regulator [Oscillospiraceae bacterium]